MTTDLLVINGPGVVARRGSAVLWAEATDLRRDSLLATVVDRLGELAGTGLSAQEFTTWLIGELTSPCGTTIPALAFSVPDAGHVLCVVHGWGRVTAPGGAVNAPGSVHRIPSALPIAVGRADLAVLATGDSLLGLESGVVPGGAALLYTRAESAAGVTPAATAPSRSSPSSRDHTGMPAAPPTPPTPAASDPGTSEQTIVSLRPDPDAPPPEWEPLPIARRATQPGGDGAPAEPEPAPVPAGPRMAIVPGVHCTRQHFNNPGALYCRVCGISLLQHTQVPVQGERPPLGVLVCDDGATYGLDGDYAIGSDPREEPGVVSGLARPLVLGDAGGGAAPTHMIIHLDGWEVLALNRSPGLPAAVLHRGDTQWTPLPSGQWARLAPGSWVGFAGRHVVFESHDRT